MPQNRSQKMFVRRHQDSYWKVLGKKLKKTYGKHEEKKNVVPQVYPVDQQVHYARSPPLIDNAQNRGDEFHHRQVREQSHDHDKDYMPPSVVEYQGVSDASLANNIWLNMKTREK